MLRRTHDTTPTPEGKVLLAFLWSFCLLSLFVHENLLLLLGTLVLGSAASAWPLALRNLRRVRFVRLLPPRARAGERVSVGWRVENPSRRPAVGLVLRDPLDGASRPSAVEARFPVVPPSGSAEATAWTSFERRGLRRLRPPVASSSFPLGLFSISRKEGAAALLVRPRVGTPTRALLARLRGDAGVATAASVRRAGVDRFHGLREFRDGDDPRRIHWRTTARRGVRTFAEWRVESGRRVTVVLGPLADRRADAHRRFERAVSVAATVVATCGREGLPVRLLLGQPPREGDRGVPARGARGVERALDALALVRATEARRPGDDVSEIRRGPGPRTVVWVSPGSEEGVLETVRAAAGAGGVALHLRADDPDLERWVTGLP
jgi:uncharacterized protein (DUF58 family)